MKPQDLKNSILQLAIQGKLVEQRPEEGTGEDLYQLIQTEKHRLIKNGTIKKEKALPEISEEEKPFDIPDSWKWTKIGRIFSLQAGKNITASDIYEEPDSEHQYLCYGGNGIRGYVSSSNRNGHYALIGRQGALCGNINFANGEFYATEHAVIVDHFNICDVIWCGYFLRALNLNQYATATAQPGLAVGNIVNVLIPLPPIAEQKRIVAKIEELLPYIDLYDKAWSKLEEFNKRFPTDMQKSILQIAIQGKLVEQRPEEGTGAELYQLIKAEKQRLIKAGTIKKEKTLLEITEDEKPFDIPDSWKWAKLGALFSIERGSSPRPIQAFQTTSEYGVNWIKIGDSEIGAKYITSTSEKITREGAEKSRLVNIGDFIISNSMSFGRPYIMAIDGYVHDGWNIIHIIKLKNGLEFNKDYLYYVLSSNLLIEQMKEKAAGGVVKNIRSDSLRELIIPLPPLDEQKRIVAKLEEILPLCEKLNEVRQ